MPPTLTPDLLKAAAATFAVTESSHLEPTIYGVTDGKAVGTYIELKFTNYLAVQCSFARGNAAKGIDFPELDVDVKTTSIRQPQSSCPFRSARQKVYGLGYSLLVFVYDKSDDDAARAARLDIQHVVFVDAPQTADYQLTRGLRDLVQNGANTDDIVAFMTDRMLPLDEIGARRLAEEVLENPPNQGYLTISNALQWRLQYSRVISTAGTVAGVMRIR